MSIPPFAAIITAAGTSARFSGEQKEKVKKEYLSIEGHTVLYRAVKAFYETPGLSCVIVTCPEGSEDETAVALEDLIDIAAVPLLIVPGGVTRKESVRIALEKLSETPCIYDYIAIHDGARPYIDRNLIIRTLAAATIAGGAVPALSVTDAVRRIGKDGLIHETIDRNGLITVQTPQIFRAKELMEAYDAFPFPEADDDAEVFMKAGYNCTVIPGSKANTKITFLSDIPDAEKQIREYAEAREKGRKSAKASKRMRELIAKGDDEE